MVCRSEPVAPIRTPVQMFQNARFGCANAVPKGNANLSSLQQLDLDRARSPHDRDLAPGAISTSAPTTSSALPTMATRLARRLNGKPRPGTGSPGDSRLRPRFPRAGQKANCFQSPVPDVHAPAGAGAKLPAVTAPDPTSGKTSLAGPASPSAHGTLRSAHSGGPVRLHALLLMQP